MPYQTDRFPSLPQFMPRFIKNGQLTSEPVGDYLADNPRTFASESITIDGVVADGDQIELSVSLPALPGGVLTKTVSLATADDTTSAAQKLAKALNDDSDLRSYGAYANSLGNVVTFYWPGPLGNCVTLSQSVPVGAETLTFGSAGRLSGGSGPIIPFNTFRYQAYGNFYAFEAGKPVNVIGAVVAALAAEGRAIQ